MRALEAETSGRLGVAATNVATGRQWSYKAGERVALCSTHKVLTAAAVLARAEGRFSPPGVPAGRRESMQQVVPFCEADLLEYAPVTRARLGQGGMTLAEVCEAAVVTSDNTAANLALAFVGGPAGLTRFLRSIGDDVTRLDRIEPELNRVAAGDPRDTTTPAAMLATLERLLLGDALALASRERLADWMTAAATGAARLRAGLPSSWRLGHKTGTGPGGATSDVGVAWPEQDGPYLFAAYLTGSPAALPVREAALAAVAQEVSGG